MAERLTYGESLRTSLHQLMEDDVNVVVMGDDVLDPYGGTFQVTQGLSTRFPERVLTTRIGEASILGLATGMALFGVRPIAELMSDDSMALAADQLVNYATKYPSVYGDKINVPLVLRAAMGGQAHGATPSQSLEKLFLGIPNLTVVAPSHFHDVGELLRVATWSDDPVLFIENKLLYPQALHLESEFGILGRSEYVDSSGFATVLVRNYRSAKAADVAVIAYGGVSRLLEPALIALAQEGIRVVACLVGCLHPLASDSVLACVRESRRALVVEEGSSAFGWSAEVSTRIYDDLHGKLLTPVKRLGAVSPVIPRTKPLADRMLVSEESIIVAVRELVR